MLLRSWLLNSFLSFVVFALMSGSPAQAKQEIQDFHLPPVDGSPYTQKIPIHISKPGPIIVTIKLNNVGYLSEKTVLASLYQEGHRYVLVSKYFDSRARRFQLQHEVDAKVFAMGREFYLSLTNYNPGKTVTGEVQISFPVAGEVIQKPGDGPLPNLVVTDVRLDESCKAIVFLKNNGAGALSSYFWKKNMPKLTLFKDGQMWGEVDIRFFDYNRALSPAGGEAVYSTGLKVFGSANIKAMIHTEDRVFEEDKTDNSKEVVLTCE